MDAHDEDEARHSSLPRSLIPHLYRHPPSSTRTTLYEDPPPTAPLPPAAPPTPFPRSPAPRAPPGARARPGLLAAPLPPAPRHRYRRAAASLSPRLTPHPDPFARPSSIYDHDAPFGHAVRRDSDRDPSYPIFPGRPVHTHPAQPYYPQQSYSSNDLLLPPDDDDSHFSFRHDTYPPYISVANLSLRSPPPTHFRSPASTEGGSGSYAYRSDSYAENLTSNDEGPSRPNKRRRAESLQETTPRKHAVLPSSYELAAQAPEMRSYTHVMSLDTLDTFSFQPAAPAPRYPSAADPEMMMREYYSRTRRPRRRETSSEDRSGAERNE
ncbi:hypothetical protein BJ912DRAFT_1141108 [Pholiota molesta]|nr:hypothetical protein BJ912DRAFT_1141108 [Pholiota molesta]